MPHPEPIPSPAPQRGSWMVVTMLAMVVVPATLTLRTVVFPATISMTNQNPTPRGYTWSLLLFIVPILVIAFWLLRHKAIKIPKKAFWRTMAILVPLGFALDFFFAHWFFKFPNRAQP